MHKRGPLSLLAFLGAFAAAAHAQDGGQVIQGGATITSPTATTTRIDQSTDRVIINWNGFSVGADSQVIFNQPGSTSVALNRVTGGNPSSILGSLSANGQIFLLNPNGIVFGQGSQVNVNALVASTLALSDSDFMSGNYRFTQDPGAPLSYVINRGTINAGSYAALVAPLVENAGTIASPGGDVLLLGTTEAVLNVGSTGLIGYSIGSVSGGNVNIKPEALSDVVRAVVNTTGLIEAGAVVENADGSVTLTGAAGTAVNSGTLTTEGVDGGSIVVNASTASALTTSSQLLSDGGLIEFSSQGRFAISGIFDVASPLGGVGEIFIDPNNITVIAGASTLPGTPGFVGAGTDGSPLITTTDGTSITDGTIEALLGIGTVRIQTGTGLPNAQAGDIIINAEIDAPANGSSLILQAHNNILINADIDFTLSAGSLALHADRENPGGFGIGGIFRSGGSTIRMGTGDLQLIASSGIGALGVPILTSGATDISIVNRGWAPIYLTNSGSNLNITNVFVSNAIGTTIGLSTWIGDVVLQNSGDITVSSLVRYTPTPTTWTQLPADPNFFTIGTMSLISGGSIFVNNVISSSDFTHVGDEPLDTHLQTGSFILNAAGGIFGDAAGRIVTGNVSVNAGAGGNDDATSGSITLSAGGEIRFSNPSALVTGNAVIIGATGTNDVAQSGNITFVTADRISSDGGTGRLGLRAGTPSGGWNNFTGNVTASTNGGAGNAGGIFLESTGFLYASSLTTVNGNVNVRALNADLSVGAVNAGTGTVTLAADDLPGGGFGNMILFGNVTASSLTAFAGGYLAVNGPVTFNGGPVSLTGMNAYIFGLSSDSDVSILAYGGDFTGVAYLSGVNSADSWSVTVSESPASAPSFDNDIVVLGDLVSTVGGISLRAADDVIFLHNGSGGANQEVVSAGGLLLRAAFQDSDGFGLVDQQTGVGTSTITAGTLTAIAEDGINLGFSTDTFVTAGTVQARNILSGVNGTPSGNINIQATGGLILSDLSGSGFAVENQGGTVWVISNGDLTVADPVSAVGSVTLWAQGADNLFSNDSAVFTSTGYIWALADRMDLTGGTLTVGTPGNGFVYLYQFSAGRLIDLGSPVDSTPGTLELSDAELDTLQFTGANGVWVVGSQAFNAGTITLSGAITLSPGATLTLNTGGDILQGTGTIAGLLLDARAPFGSVSLPNPANNVRFLSGTSGGTFTYVDADILSIRDWFSAGITSGGDVSVRTVNGDIGLDSAITATGSLVYLEAGGAHWIGDFHDPGGVPTSDINAALAVLVANAGIGETQFGVNAIETNVDVLQAYNWNSGGNPAAIRGIHVNDLSGGLTLAAIFPFNAVWSEGAGDVNISAVSFITVQDSIYSNGNLTLTALSGATSGDNVNVFDWISSNGSITLRAEDFIVLDMGPGNFIYSPSRLTLHAAYNDLGGGGGSISHFSGDINVDELVAISENGISLGQFGGAIFANQLQAINGGTSPNGDVAISVDSNVELIGLTGGAALMNTATVGTGHLTFTSPGAITITDDVLAVGNVTIAGTSIFDNACITTINGAITLNGTGYPGGVNGSVFLGPDACFHVYGPADYVQILFDGDPLTDLQLNVTGDINVAGRVVLLSEGNIVIANGVSVTSGTGIIAMADWEGGDPDGFGQIVTQGTGLFRSNEFSFSAASGIFVATQSLNPGLPALFQVRNARFDGVNNSSGILLNHTGLATFTDLNLAFEPGSPAFEQDHIGTADLYFTGGGLHVLNGSAADDVSTRGHLFIHVTGTGAVLENDGVIRSISGGFLWTVDGSGSQLRNDGAIVGVAGISQFAVQGNNSLLINNGTIQVTNGFQLVGQSGVSIDVINAGTLLSSSLVSLLNTTAGGISTNNGTISANGDVTISTSAGGTSTNNGNITAGDDFLLLADGTGGVAINNGDVITFNNQFGSGENNATVIRADRILLQPGSTIQVTDQAFVLLQASTAGRPIDLGSATDLAAAVELSDAELDTIFTAPNLMYRLSIGTQVTGGPITITAPLTLDGTGFVGALILNSGTTVTQTAPLFVPNHLVFRTGGAVTMNNPGNDAWQLTATVGGTFSYVDADEIGIASFLGTGVFSNNNDVTITTLNGPIRFGSPVPPPFGGTFSGGPINAGTGTVRLTAQGLNGYIQDLQNGIEIIAHAAILVADAGIGSGSTVQNSLEVELDELQAINTGLGGGQRYIEIVDLSGDLVIRAIDPGVSTFGVLNNASFFGLVSIHANNGSLTVNDAIQVATGWIWLFTPETAATNNDLHINADLTVVSATPGGTNYIYLWAGDSLTIGEGGSAPNLFTPEHTDLLPNFGDTDNIGSLTQLSGTIVSNTLRAQSENGISLGALGGSLLDTNFLSLINTGLQAGSGTDIAPTGNVVVNNQGNLTLIEQFGNGMGLVNTAGAAGQGNLTISTTGILTVDVPVFGARQVSLTGSSIVVNSRISSAAGPILLNGTSYPTLTPNATVTVGVGGAFQVYAPGANPDYILIWSDNNGGTDQDLVYAGGNQNVTGSIIIISEGDITIPDGVTLQAGQGLVLLADWDFAYQNGSGRVDASGATLISSAFQLGAAQGIEADLQALSAGGTAIVQAQNRVSGDILLSFAGNAVIDSLGQVFLANSPGLSNAGGGSIFFDASLSLTLGADVVALGGGTIHLSAGLGIFDDGDPTTEITTTGALILDAGSGGIGNGGLDGTVTAGYLDVSLGGVGTLTIAAGGDVFIQEVGAGTTLHSSQILAIDTSVVGIMLGLSSLTGDVDFDASFGAGAGAVVAVGNDITIGGSAIISPSDRITLIAGAGGSISQLTGGLLSATQLVLNAAGSITLPSTIVRQLSVVAGGDVAITNTGDITLADLTGSGFAVDVDGYFSLSAHSTITVVAPVVAASVTLTADEAIAVLSAGRIEATAGDILLSTTLGSIAVTVDSFTDTILEATGNVILDSGLDVLISDEDNDTTFETVKAIGGLFISGRDITLDGVIEGLTASLTASRDVNVSGLGIVTQDSLFIDADGDVEISGVGLVSQNSFISILAGGSFTHLAPMLATSGGGFVTVTALEGDITSFAPITAGQSIGLIAENGDIDILGLLSAPSVALFSPAGAVRSLNTALDVRADFLQITAATGVGTLFTPLDTDVDVLFIVGNGDYYVREVDDLNITANTNGILRLRLGGALTGIVFVDDARIDATGAVNLSTSVRALRIITTNDDIVINEGSGVEIDVLDAGTGNVTVTAAGAITGDLGLDIIANDVALSAVGGIDLDVRVSGILTASSPGAPINLRSAGALILGNVNAGASTVTIDAAGALTGGLITGSSAFLTAASIDVDTAVSTLTATATATGAAGDVTIDQVASLVATVTAADTVTINLSGAGADLTATIQSFLAVLDAGDVIDIHTTVAQLDVDGGTLLLTESDGLQLNTSVLTGNATITVGGFLIGGAGTALTANAATITAGAIQLSTSVVSLNAFTGGGTIDISELNALSLGTVSAGTGAVFLSAGGAISDANGSAVNVTGSVFSVSSVGGFGGVANPIETQVGQISVSNTVSGEIGVVNLGDLRVNSVVNVTGAGDVLLDVTGDILVTGAVSTASGDIVVLSSGTITVDDGASVISGDTLALTATTDIVICGIVSAVNAATLFAGEDIVICETGVVTGNPLTMTAGGTVTVLGTISGGTIVSTGDIVLTNVNITGTSISYTSTAGDILISGATLTSTLTSIVLAAQGGDLTIIDSTIDAKTDLALSATGNAFIGDTATGPSSLEASDGTLSLSAGGYVVIENSSLTSVAGPVTVTAAGDMTIVNASLNGGTGLSLSAGGDLTIDPTVIVSAGDINLASAGLLSLIDTTVTSTGGAVTLSGHGIVVNGGGVDADTDLTATPTAGVDMLSTTFTAGQALTIAGDGDVNLAGSFTGATLEVETLGNLTVQGSYTATSDVPFTDDELRLFAAGTLAGDPDLNSDLGGVRIEGLLGVNLFGGSGGTVSAVGHIEIESNGSVWTGLALSSSAGAVSILALGDVGIEAAVFSFGGITIDAGGDVNLGGLLTAAGQTVTVSSGGRISDGNAAGNNVAAASVVLTAATGIGTAADPIETDVANLTTSGGGDQFIAETDSVLVNASTGGTFSLTLAAGNLIGDITAQTAILSAPDFINVDTTVANLTATSGGAILIDETDSVSVLVTSGATATINLAAGTLSGSITAVTADVDAPTINLSTQVGTLTATGGSLTIVELDGLLLNDVVVTTATITAGGTIADADAGVNLTAFSATLTGTQIGSAGDFLSVDLSQLTATATGVAPATPGSLWINEASSLTAVNLTAGGLGVINLTTGGFITDNDADVDFSGSGVVVTATFFGTTANPIQTSVSSLSVTATAGDIIVTETDGLTALNLDAADDVVLVAGGAITAFGGGTDVFADSATITAPSINVDTDVNTLIATATAGDVVIDEVDALDVTVHATGTADIDLADGALTGTLTALTAVLSGPDGVNVQTAVGQLAVGSSDGDIDVFNTGNLLLTSASAPNGSIDVGVFGTLVVEGSVTAGFDIELGSGVDLVLIDALVSAGQNVDLNAFGDVRIDASTVSAVGNATVAAGGDLSILASLVETTDGSISLTAGGAVLLQGSELDAEGTGLSVTISGGTVTLDGSSVFADGTLVMNSVGATTLTSTELDADASITFTTGVLTVSGGILTTDNDFIQVTAAGDVSLLGTIVDAGTFVVFDVIGGVTVQGSALITSDGVVLTATGAISLFNSAVDSGGIVDLTGASVGLTNVSVLAGGLINFTSTGDMTLLNVNLDGDTSVFLGALGSLTLFGSVVTAGDGDLLALGAGVSLTGVQLSASNEVEIGSLADLTLEGDITAGSDVTLSAEGALAAENTTIDAAGDISLTAAGVDLMGTSFDALGDVVLVSSADLAIDGTSVDAGGILFATSTGDLAVIDSDLSAAGQIRLTSGAALFIGDEFGGSSIASSNGGVLATSAGSTTVWNSDITAVNAGLEIIAGGDATFRDAELTADVDLIISTSGNVFIESSVIMAGPGLTFSGGSSVYITAGMALSMLGTSLIGAHDDIFLGAGGDISIYNGGVVVNDLDLDDLGSVTIQSYGGNVSLVSVGLEAYEDLTITAAGSISSLGSGFVSGLGALSGELELRAGGALTIDGSITADNAYFIASADVDMSAIVLLVSNDIRIVAGGDITISNGELTVTDLDANGDGSIAIESFGGSVSLTDVAVTAFEDVAVTAAGNIGLVDVTFVASASATLPGLISLTAGGGIDAAGDFSADEMYFTALGDMTLQGTLSVATGLIELFAAGTFASDADYTAGALVVQALGDLSLYGAQNGRDITTIGNVTITSGGDLLLAQNVVAGGVLSLDAAGDVSIDPVTLTADAISGVAGGAFSILGGTLNATAGGVAIIAGSVGLSDVVISATGDVSVEATGDITVVDGQVSTDADIEILGEGTVRLSGTTLNAGFSITVYAGPSADLDQAFLTALGGIIDVRGGDLRLVDSSLTAGGRVDVAAETGFLYSNSTNYQSFSQRVFLFANGPLTVDAGGLSSPVEVVFQALGDVSLYNVAAYNGTIRVLAGLDATLDDVLFDLVPALVVEAGGDVAILGSEIDASGDIQVDAGGSITVTANSAAAAGLASGDDILLTAGGNVVVSDADADPAFATLSAADDVRIVAGGSIQQATGQLVATELVLYAATGISILVADVDVLQATNAISGALVVYNVGGLTIQDLDGLGYGLENQGGDIVIETGFNGSLLVSDAISASGQVTIEADGNITIDAAIEGDDIVLEAAGAIAQTGGLLSAATLEVEAAGGIDLTATAVGAAQLLNTGSGDVSIVALGDLLLADLNAQGYAVLNTAGGVSAAADGNLEVASDLTADGAVDLTAGGAIAQTGGLLTGTTLTASAASGILLDQTDISVLVASTSATGDILVNNLGSFTAQSVVAQDGDITLRATLGGSLSVAFAQALGHTVTIEAAGSVDEGVADAAADLLGLEVNITAGADIGDGGSLEIDAVRATLTVTGIGGIDVVDTANGLDLVSAVAPNGVVRITSAGGPLIARLVTAGDDAFVSTTGAGDILLGLVQAGGEATITSAAGSIFDGNDLNGEALNVQTGGDAFMSAAEVIGTLVNCIEIQIGGSLTLFAGGSLGGTSINLCGTTGGANPVIVIGGPGLSTVNGLEFLPLLQSARAAMNDLLDIRRRYDPILQRVLGDVTIWPPEVVEDQRRPAPSQRQEEPKLPGESAEKKKD